MYSAYKLNKQGDNIQPWCTPFPTWKQSVVPRLVLVLLLDLHTDFSGMVVWYSQLLKNFPQFVVIHTVKGFHVVNEAHIFLDSLAFSMTQWMLAIWSLVPLAFLNTACISGSFLFTYCWSLAWRILSIILLACETVQLCGSLNIRWHCLSLGLEWKLTFSNLLRFPNLLAYWVQHKTWPTGEGNGRHFSMLALKTPWQVKFNYPYLNILNKS